MSFPQVLFHTLKWLLYVQLDVLVHRTTHIVSCVHLDLNFCCCLHKCDCKCLPKYDNKCQNADLESCTPDLGRTLVLCLCRESRTWLLWPFFETLRVVVQMTVFHLLSLIHKQRFCELNVKSEESLCMRLGVSYHYTFYILLMSFPGSS